MKRTVNNRGLIVLALVVLAAGGGASYWMHSVAQQARENVGRMRQEVPSEAEVTKMLAESERKVGQYQFELEHLEQGVPNVAYVPTLLTELENLGKANQLEMIGVRPVVERDLKQSKREGSKSMKGSSKAYEEIDIDIVGRGTYGRVLATVSALQKFPKVVAVKTLSMTPKRDPNSLGGQPTLEAVVRIKAYVFADRKAEEPKGSGGTQVS